MLNFLVPISSWVFILTDNSIALNECLGKGYLNFLPTKNHYCTNDDILCWVWFGLVSIMMSDIIDFYCLYQCIKNIKKSTVESRYMLSKKAYTNRKRYGMLIVIPMQCLHCTEVCFASFLSGVFITAIVVNPPERKLAKRTSV